MKCANFENLANKGTLNMFNTWGVVLTIFGSAYSYFLSIVSLFKQLSRKFLVKLKEILQSINFNNINSYWQELCACNLNMSKALRIYLEDTKGRIINIDTNTLFDPEPKGHHLGYYVFDSLPDISMLPKQEVVINMLDNATSTQDTNYYRNIRTTGKRWLLYTFLTYWTEITYNLDIHIWLEITSQMVCQAQWPSFCNSCSTSKTYQACTQISTWYIRS